MENLLNGIIKNLKECYKESISSDNEKLQDLILTTLTDVKKLEDVFLDNENITLITKQENTSKRYKYEQVRDITKVQLRLAKDIISYEVAEREILKVASSFPVHNLRQYNKRLKETLLGIGTYGFAFPANWAKALLEETSNNSLVIQAFKEQQDLYLKKDGRRNEKLDKVLNSINE